MMAFMSNVPVCPVCGTESGSAPLCNVEGFSVFACANCQADYVFPSPEAVELKRYYDRKDWFESGERGGYSNYDEQTAWSINVVKAVLSEFSDETGKSVLDIGCGYGTHLDLASGLGWKCFGVELSDHARSVARERLDYRALVVESVSELIPHEFDLILMLDVIEHLPSPYPLLYSLFSIGAITPRTRLVLTTPNAGSMEARNDPAGWSYRHPPSHLTYYTASALEFLFQKLHFTDIKISGMHPLIPNANLELENFGGLLAEIAGSDFTEFMRERYIPGTWSEIAEYEHLPRYALARNLAVGKKVLDFGCGTGYGSAMLAEVADHVTGLDIDSAALSWARSSHPAANLDFIQSPDFGADLPEASFDLITCFEMIEHVGHEAQQAAIKSFSRLLRQNGVLLISTPNPEVTKLYGENPYHIREMSETELQELIGAEFSHVQIYRQKVRCSITFDRLGSEPLSERILSDAAGEQPPMGFIGVCARQPQPPLPAFAFFDEKRDYIQSVIVGHKLLNTARFEAYRANEQLGNILMSHAGMAAHGDALHAEVNAYREQSARMQTEIDAYREQSARMQTEIDAYRLQAVKMMEKIQDYDLRLTAMAADLDSSRAPD